MAVVNKRIFDTDNALKGTFNGLYGKWQIITYLSFVFAYAIITGWINRLHDFTLLQPNFNNCFPDLNVTNKTNGNLTIEFFNFSVIQKLSGKRNFEFQNTTIEYGNTVATQFQVLCDLKDYIKSPRFSNYLGYAIGCLILGFASDRGGRKMIILACIWTTGIMSLFQLVGHDFISYIFFEFFIGLFIGGVHASFLPAIIEMFPINFRTFYGVFFHLVVTIFELILPWLAKSLRSWTLLQVFVTVPILLTAILQLFAYESIFWYLAHKEYDKAIRVLIKLAKRNGILFESKFKQAKDFLHAKHSKATQVDILPILRLQDIEVLGKKYPQVDMAELQKQKLNNSKLRRFLNSLKGESYRSTNTIYRPFDFIYSPTLLVYVLILAGLWFTNGLTKTIESVPRPENLDVYAYNSISNLSLIFSSSIAIVLAIFKFGRRWVIFLSYLVIEICLLGSLIDQKTFVTQTILYHLCKLSSHLGFIFLMLITAELFPTSLRCSGMGICFIMKALGSLIASPNLLDNNQLSDRLVYSILTLFFGSMTLFLPETKTFPLPRSILQIEAMPTRIGKKLRSRKVKYACERRQNQLAENLNQNSSINDGINLKSLSASPTANNNIKQNETINQSAHNHAQTSITKPLLGDNSGHEDTSSHYPGSYDTVTSVHDIEQDDHIYYAEKKENSQLPLLNTYERKLGKILEVPSKNITRNNSVNDVAEYSNSKV